MKKTRNIYLKIQKTRENFYNPIWRRPMQLRNGLWIGFLIFSGIAALLFWIVLYTYFEVYYRREITDELRNVAWEISSQYGSENFEQAMALLTKSNNYFAQVISEDNHQIILSYSSDGEKDQIENSEIVREDLFERLDDTDGYCFYYVDDGDRDHQWAVEAIVLANIDGYRHVLVLSCSTIEIDMVKHMLYNRGGLSLAAVLVLTFIFAFFLANFYARPFRHLNDAAKKMATGKFDTPFIPEGPVEAVQLAKTLNHAEKEFEATEQLRRDFIANISHDMKTPLTVIRAYAEMIEAFSGEIPEKRQEHVNRIIDETDRLTDLINELMELSSLQSGTMKLHYEEFSMNAMVQTVISRIRIKDISQGFDIKLYADTVYTVRADRQLIHRAFYNLLNNAVKYSGESKIVEIHLSPQNGQLLVQIRDYGIGMSQEDLEHIWDRFYRSPELGNTIRGNGIGLNIVSEIFRCHNIPYGVESRKGKGSTFWFII